MDIACRLLYGVSTSLHPGALPSSSDVLADRTRSRVHGPFSACRACTRFRLANVQTMTETAPTTTVYTEGDRILCSVCGRSVLQPNWTLHESRCHRQTVACERCGLRVHESHLDAHRRDSCSSAAVECEYCELTVERRELAAHQRYCGARTDWCDRCGKYVMKRDWTGHGVECAARGETADQNGELDRERVVKGDETPSPAPIRSWRPWAWTAAAVVVAVVCVQGLSRRRQTR